MFNHFTGYYTFYCFTKFVTLRNIGTGPTNIYIESEKKPWRYILMEYINGQKIKKTLILPKG